jgi:hypothetical protein
VELKAKRSQGTDPRSSTLPIYHLTTAVWGAGYLDNFLNVAIPTQLSDGNLVCLARGAEVTYKIFTTPADAEIIRGSKIFAHLARAVPVQFRLMSPDQIGGTKYDHLTHAHRWAVEEADADRARLVFLAPDLVCSDGTFARVLEADRSGKRAVMAAGLRVTQETFVPQLHSRFPRDERGAVTIPPRDLARLVLGNLHPLMDQLFWGSSPLSHVPSNLLWRVADEGLLARCFHLHPLMVLPDRCGIELRGTVDDEYLSQACRDPADYHIVQDSDELMLCSLDSRAVAPPEGQRASRYRVATWAIGSTSVHHRRLVRYPIRVHLGERSAAWHAAEADAERTVKAILLLRGLLRVASMTRVLPVAGAARQALLRVISRATRLSRHANDA